MLYLPYHNPSGNVWNLIGDDCFLYLDEAKYVAFDKYIDSQTVSQPTNLDVRIKKDELWHSLPVTWVKTLGQEMYSLNTGATAGTVTRYGVCGRGTTAFTALLPQLRLVYRPH